MLLIISAGTGYCFLSEQLPDLGLKIGKWDFLKKGKDTAILATVTSDFMDSLKNIRHISLQLHDVCTVCYES